MAPIADYIVLSTIEELYGNFGNMIIHFVQLLSNKEKYNEEVNLVVDRMISKIVENNDKNVVTPNHKNKLFDMVDIKIKVTIAELTLK